MRDIFDLIQDINKTIDDFTLEVFEDYPTDNDFIAKALKICLFHRTNNDEYLDKEGE